MNNLLNQNLILRGKKVLLRVDLNVPMKNGAITETSRIEKILPTIKLLIKKNYILFAKKQVAPIFQSVGAKDMQHLW